MCGLTIKKFDIEMLDECVELYMKTYSQEPWNESWDSKDDVIHLIQNHYANNYFLGFVVVKDEKIVGVSIGFLKPWIKGMEYYIDEFFIHSDFHRQGIGSKFVAAIKNELCSQNIHAIMLNTERDYPSYKFYESIGFKVDKSTVILYATF